MGLAARWLAGGMGIHCVVVKVTGPSSERTAERKAMPEDVVHEALRVLVEHAKYPYLDLEEIQAIHTEACEAVETLVEHRAGEQA